MSYIDKEIVLKTITDIMSDCKIVHKHRALNRNIKQIRFTAVERIHQNGNRQTRNVRGLL